jgi:hypothetical protein
MCKLCNSDSPPILSSKQPINIVARDYIGTFPCKKCARVLQTTQLGNPDKSFDYIILTKLYWRYRAFNNTQLGAKKQASSQLKCILGIQPIRKRSTGIVIYKAYVRGKNQTDYLGTFPTLQSAVEAKITFLQNSGRTKGLNQLLNKLKELTCQQN